MKNIHLTCLSLALLALEARGAVEKEILFQTDFANGIPSGFAFQTNGKAEAEARDGALRIRNSQKSNAVSGLYLEQKWGDGDFTVSVDLKDPKTAWTFGHVGVFAHGVNQFPGNGYSLLVRATKSSDEWRLELRGPGDRVVTSAVFDLTKKNNETSYQLTLTGTFAHPEGKGDLTLKGVLLPDRKDNPNQLAPIVLTVVVPEADVELKPTQWGIRHSGGNQAEAVFDNFLISR